MSDSSTSSTSIKSIRHQKILDEAADNPEASLEDIAAEIPSATAELVERVLEKYGDPADADSDIDTHSPPEPELPDTAEDHVAESANSGEDEDSPETETETEGEVDEEPQPDIDALSEKERATLRAIHEHPDATQREIADVLDVSGATVSNRVNALPGFDWEARESFTAAIFGDTDSAPSADTGAESEPTAIADGATSATSDAPDPDGETETDMNDQQAGTSRADIDSTTVEQLSDRLTNIEEQLETMRHHDDGQSLADDPELTHKVVHACLESDVISEDEELRLLRVLLD